MPVSVPRKCHLAHLCQQDGGAFSAGPRVFLRLQGHRLHRGSLSRKASHEVVSEIYKLLRLGLETIGQCQTCPLNPIGLVTTQPKPGGFKQGLVDRSSERSTEKYN